MGCQSAITLGDNLTFSICTHDPDTGALTDADSAPAYRIYEDETATPILTGTMAVLDTANTTGFYTEQIACTAANGFENDKSYTIYIEATISGDTGGISYGFLVRTLASDVWGYSSRTLTQSAAAVAAAVSGATLTIRRGDTWSASLTDIGALTDYVSLDFTVKRSYSDEDTGAIIRIRKNASGLLDGLQRLNGAALASPVVSADGTITIDDLASGDITISLAARASDELSAEVLTYDVQMITASAVTTMTEGSCVIVDDITRLIA